MGIFGYVKRSELEKELRAEIMQELKEEAMIKAREEVAIEERNRKSQQFVVNDFNPHTMDINKISRILKSKITDFKHIRDVLERDKMSLRKSEYDLALDAVKKYTEKHAQGCFNDIITLDEANIDYIRDFDSLRLDSSERNAIVYREFVVPSPREYRTIKSLDYVYKAYIRMQKDGKVARAYWGVDFIPRMIYEDKTLKELIPMMNLEVELDKATLDLLKGSVTCTTSVTAKLMILDIILTTSFKGEFVHVASLAIPGNMDKTAYGSK